MAVARKGQAPPLHPGEFLLEEFLRPLNLTQTDVAHGMGIGFPRLNEILNGKRPITLDTALRIGRYFGTPPDLWLALQQKYDLWAAQHDPETRAMLDQIAPLNYAGSAATVARIIKDMKAAPAFEGRETEIAVLEAELRAWESMTKELPTAAEGR
jgi:addiction module HigA family antidote